MMGIIGQIQEWKKNYGRIFFWEILEGIIDKILSMIGSSLWLMLLTRAIQLINMQLGACVYIIKGELHHTC